MGGLGIRSEVGVDIVANQLPTATAITSITRTTKSTTVIRPVATTEEYAEQAEDIATTEPKNHKDEIGSSRRKPSSAGSG